MANESRTRTEAPVVAEVDKGSSQESRDEEMEERRLTQLPVSWLMGTKWIAGIVTTEQEYHSRSATRRKGLE
jgi:hypothetical protein